MNDDETELERLVSQIGLDGVVMMLGAVCGNVSERAFARSDPATGIIWARRGAALQRFRASVLQRRYAKNDGALQTDTKAPS